MYCILTTDTPLLLQRFASFCLHYSCPILSLGFLYVNKETKLPRLFSSMDLACCLVYHETYLLFILGISSEASPTRCIEKVMLDCILCTRNWIVTCNQIKLVHMLSPQSPILQEHYRWILCSPYKWFLGDLDVH